MINVSSLWHQALFNDNRAYEEYADITLTDNTELHLRNEDIWQNGFKIDDAVSSDSDLEIGAAIVNKLNLTINNIYGKFDAYDFTGAKVFAYIGLHLSDGTFEKIKKGRFIVQEATYNGELINLSCFDYMSKFDMPYVPTGVSFPSTAEQIVVNACRDAGVALGTADFPHKDTAIASKPSEESTTFREVIAWVAQICGCFARVNVDGQLELKWYEQSTLEHILDGTDGGFFDEGTPRYTSGDTANGGVFNPWETGTEYDGGAFQWTEHVHYINSVYNRTISIDDVVITGIRIKVKTESNDSNNSEISYLTGTEGYVIEISGNPFITTSNVDAIGTWLGNQLIGFKFRKASITHGSDPSIEAGDVALVWDRKGNVYPILVSHTTFTVGGSQTTISSAQTPTRNSAARFSVQTKNYVEMRERLKDERSLREQMEAQLAEDIANSNGMYYTEVTDEQTQATKYYLHNKPLLAESMIRILVSDVGITVTNDGGEHWYGLTVNGNLIANILSATGITADWIRGGTLTLGGDNNVNGTLIVYDASGNVIGRWDNSGILVNSGTIQLTFGSGNTIERTTVSSSGISSSCMNSTASLSTGILSVQEGQARTDCSSGALDFYRSSSVSLNIGDEVSLDNDWYIRATGKKLSITAPGIDIHSSSFLDIDGVSPTITNSSDSTTPSKLTLSSSVTLNGHSGVSLNVNGSSSMYLTESDIYAYAGGAIILDASRRSTTIYSSNTVSSTVYTNAYFSFPEIDFYCNGSRVMSLDYKGLDYLKNGYYGSINCGNVTLNVYYGIITGYSTNSSGGGGGTTPPEEDPDIVIIDPDDP